MRIIDTNTGETRKSTSSAELTRLAPGEVAFDPKREFYDPRRRAVVSFIKPTRQLCHELAQRVATLEAELAQLKAKR